MRKIVVSLARLAAVAVTVTQLTSCVGGESYSSDAGAGDTAETTTKDVHPGTLIGSTPFTDVDDAVKSFNAIATKVRYRSTSGIDGSPTEVTGSVFVPAGVPPPGGWPIVALAHDTTGITADCSPSRYPDLLGSVSQVAQLLAIDFAVAVTDYQGLGGPGANPYLDPKTAAYNVIDSVRALREVSRDVSKRWSALGTGQGGAAAWAATEESASYASEIPLDGSISLAPMADMTGLAQLAATGTLTPEQTDKYVWLLASLQKTMPNFDIDDYRHGEAARAWNTLSACTPSALARRAAVIDGLGRNDLVPSSPEATERLSTLLAKMAVPQRRSTAPMLVIYGGADRVTPSAWTAGAIAKACGMGSKIASIFEPDKGSSNLDVSEYPGWLLARAEGLPAPVTC